MKTKRAGIGVKFVILALLAASILALLTISGRLSAAKTLRDTLSKEVQDQTERNAALAEDIANCDDPERIASIARDKLGLLGRDEIVFIDTSK